MFILEAGTRHQSGLVAVLSPFGPRKHLVHSESVCVWCGLVDEQKQYWVITDIICCVLPSDQEF